MQYPQFEFDSSSKTPLVAQVMAAVRAAQAGGQLVSGERIWSIRAFAVHFGVSTFTVAEAYDRLVADGVLQARRGDGFFVAPPRGRRHADADLPNLQADAFWLSNNLYEPPAGAAKPGSGGLPPDWYEQDSLRTALRVVASKQGNLVDYGDPKGLPPLRDWLQRTLGEDGLELGRDQIVLTHGASQALTIAINALTRPGDTVLVDDPGQFGLQAALALHGVRVIGVPWTAQGPDLDRLGQLLVDHAPKVFFTNPWMQNPTGASYSAAVAYRVLQLAEQFDFWVVENDVSNGMGKRSAPSLAAMEQLKRVVYIGSFSKTLAPSLRVGFVAASRAVADAFTHHKMLIGLNSSEIAERLTLQLLIEGRQRHRLARLRERLDASRDAALQLFDSLSMDVFARAGGSPFLWAHIAPERGDPVPLARLGIGAHVMLAPGALFRVGQPATPWMRFNVAYMADPRVAAFLSVQLG